MKETKARFAALERMARLRMEELSTISADTNCRKSQMLVYSAHIKRMDSILKDMQYQQSLPGKKGSKKNNETKLLALFDDEYISENENLLNIAYDNIFKDLEEKTLVSEDDFRFLSLLSSGLGTETICCLTGINRSNFYTRKSRLLRHLQNSDWSRKEEFLRMISI